MKLNLVNMKNEEIKTGFIEETNEIIKTSREFEPGKRWRIKYHKPQMILLRENLLKDDKTLSGVKQLSNTAASFHGC